MKKQRYWLQGGVTVFLSIILLIMFGFIGTVAELVRICVAERKVEQAGELSVISAFSYYSREIWDEYGIFLLWNTKEEVEANFSAYYENNLIKGSHEAVKRTDLLGINLNEAVLRNETYATDENGRNVAEQICSIMKKQAGDKIIENILMNSETISQGKEAQEAIQELSEEASVFYKPEEQVPSIYYSLEEGMKTKKSTYEYLLMLRDGLDKVKREENKNIEWDKKNFEEVFSEFLGDWKKQKEYLEKNIAEAESYKISIRNTIQNFGEWRENLYKENKNWSIEVQDLVEDELDSIDENLENQKDDKYEIEANKKRMEEQYQILCEIEKKLQVLFDDKRGNGFQYKNKKKLQEYSEGLEEAVILSKQINFSNIKINFQNEKALQEDVSFLEKFKTLLNSNWLGLLTENLSKKTMEEEKLLTNNKDKTHDTALWTETGWLEQETRKAYLCEYIEENFNDYSDEKNENKSLLYQKEYILGGYCSDEENLSYVTKEIFQLRTGFNYIYLLKDKKSRAEAVALATSIVGFTGLPLAVKAMELVILGLWAKAESIVDVRNLLEGNNVRLIKKKQDWNLSLRNIGKAFEKMEGKKEEHTEEGLGYEDYLKALFMKKKSGTLVYRIMSMIQMNVQQEFHSKFQMKTCIVDGVIEIESEIPSLFVSFMFIQELFPGQWNRFIVRKQVQFQY